MDNTLEKIHLAALKFLVPLTTEETYKKIVNEAIKLIQGEDGMINILKDNKLVNIYSSTIAMSTFQPRKRGFAYNALAQRKAYVIHLSQFKKIYPKIAAQGVKSILFIPLYYKDHNFGVLAVRSHVNQDFTNEQLRILKLFGTLANLAIRKTQLYSEAQNTIKIKEKFIAMAAHELRTPLTSMSGYAELLHKKLTEKNIPEKKWTRSLLIETHRLTNLIEELLEVNRLNAGKLEYHFNEANIEEILRKTLNKLYITYPDINVVVKRKYRKSRTIIGDQKKLSQAIFNILDNAVKFSSNKSKIRVKLNYDKNWIIIVVQDEGKGIAQDEIPRVLGGFYKATGNEQEGMGVGLFYTRSIVEKHQGKLSLGSQINKGTEVEIKLPTVKYGRITNGNK